MLNFVQIMQFIHAIVQEVTSHWCVKSTETFWAVIHKNPTSVLMPVGLALVGGINL